MSIPLNTDNTVCIVVDIQERLVPVLNGHQDFVEKTCQMLQGLQALEIPLLAAEQYPKGLGHTVAAVKNQLGDTPVFEKTNFSAWQPDAEAFIRQHQARNVILLGVETHVCMLQTVADLRAQGFEVYIPLECTTSRTVQNKQNGLAQMQAMGAVVSNIESLLFMLLKDAKHPAFKTISKLIQ